uniref:RNA-directed DNA polymerase, eukaryota n=1 Tax=Tanacetum cinerariifolium TaxID=118510 RepID=A0A699H645_TANCI|nr:RNA-directed DNA polymerase, eukaryota [Tanacetum cinerariifolium]
MNDVNGAWCIFGDLNVVRGNEERMNSQVNLKKSNDFNDFINEAKLVEIPIGGFTRVSYDGMKFCKLDQFLVNEEFCNLWDNISVVTLDQKLSDHCPIVLKDVDLDFGPKPFRIFDVWLEEGDIRHVVEEAWKMEIKNMRPDCVDDGESWMDKENEYGRMLHQKARIRWDIEGDETSNFYHSCIQRDSMWPIFCCERIEKFSVDDATLLEMEFREEEILDAIRGCG